MRSSQNPPNDPSSDERPGWRRFLALDPLWFDNAGVIRAKATRGTDQPAP